MTKNNKRKKHGISKRRYIRAVLLITMLLTVTAAGCSRKPSKPTGNSTTATPELTEAVTPEPTEAATPKPTEAATPKPTEAATPKPTATSTPKPSFGTAFTLSGTGGCVTFSGNTVEVSKAKIGDTVRYGSYEQDNNTGNGAEAIEWLVLDKQDGKLLLLSKDVLDAKQYNEKYIGVTWETCTLRSWLNGTFYNTAFSSAEQGQIATTKVKNEDNPMYGREGGNDTEDKVFLLSIGEALNYFESDYSAEDPASCAKAMEYAEAQGVWVSSAGNAWWWLRSPGNDDSHAADVSSDGSLSMIGIVVINGGCGVRPAFWLNLES